MRLLGCLGLATLVLFMTLFIPILHILTVVPFLICLVAFGIVGFIQLVGGGARR
jgi:hypothetical protein